MVASKFKVNRGILQCLQQSASLFAGIVTSFCNALNWELLGLLVSQFKDRLFFGVHQELLDLMKVPIINSQRARALFKAGYHTLADLSNADLLSIEKCLYDSISFDTQKRDGESKYDEKQRNELRLVFITGKAGLTVPEAAKEISEGARKYLQNEMGVSAAVWAHNTSDKNAGIRQEELVKTANRHCSEENHVSKHQPITVSTSKNLDKDNKIPDIDMENQPFVNRILANKSQENSILDELNNNNHLPTKTYPKSPIATNKGPQSIPTADKTPIKIIDVFQSVNFFQFFCKKFHVFAEGGLSLAVNAVQSDGRKVYKCILAEGVYLQGVSLCLGERIVFYLNLQESGSSGLSFAEKISFLREVLLRNDFTLIILDARQKLKKLHCFVPLLHANLIFKDPKIAEWLHQSNIEPNFNEMVSIMFIIHVYVYIPS